MKRSDLHKKITLLLEQTVGRMSCNMIANLLLEELDKSGMQPPMHHAEVDTGYRTAAGEIVTYTEWFQGWEPEDEA